MKLGRAVRYSLTVMGHLASSQSNFVLCTNLANKYDIPHESLHKILQQFTKIGVLKSKHGISGGYALAKEPDEITLLEIVETIEHSAYDPLDLPEKTSNKRWAVRMDRVVKKAISEYKKVLEEATLADMISGLKER